MKLRGINFGMVWGASGAEGFFGGTEYFYHWVLKILGILNLAGMTFVAKTMTVNRNDGNMPLRDDGVTPRHWFPASVFVSVRSWWNGVALNKIGLSNRGAEFLLRKGIWQKRTKPFLLSFMQIATCPGDPEREFEMKLEEARQFVAILRRHLPNFRAKIGLQLNVSCPNAYANATVTFILRTLDIAAGIGIPIVVKVAVNMSVEDALRISRHPACDALCVSNTVPFELVPEDVRMRLFGFLASPLSKVGTNALGGGISGAYLLPLVEDWIKRARAIGIEKPINAGGGILSFADVVRLYEAGATNFFLGSIVFLRPWRAQGIIRKVNALALGGPK